MLSSATSPGPIEPKPETVAAAPDMRRVTEFAVALRLQHRVDRGADVGHHRARLCRGEARSHGRRHQIVFFAQQRRRFAEHDGAADLRELAAIARREFAHNNVAFLHPPAIRRRHRFIVRAGAEQDEIVLRAERFRVPAQFTRQFVLAHPGPRQLEQMLEAKLGDACCLACIGKLGIDLAPCRFEYDGIGRSRAGQEVGQALADAVWRRRQSGDADFAGGRSERRLNSINDIVGRNDVRAGAAFARPLDIPSRRHHKANRARRGQARPRPGRAP